MPNNRVLVVDDEADCCQFFKEYLTVRGFQVDTAFDGLKAKKLLEDREYDFIFFDCNMPGLSGVELCRVMRENSTGAKKIMISGYDLINEEFTRNLGVDVFLKKPISLGDVWKVVKGEEEKNTGGG